MISMCGLLVLRMCGSTAEFEWRFNRRKSGKNILNAGMQTIMSASVMINRSFVALFSEQNMAC